MTGSITLTRGLPGSGKSTWAKNWVEADPDRRARVNRDDLRMQMFGKPWGVDENAVTKAEEALVKTLLASGRDVVVDATHLRAAFVKRWLKHGPVTLCDFDVPVAIAVANDAERAARGERAVGEDVIRGLAKRYGIPAEGTLPKIDLSLTRPAAEFAPAPAWDPNLPSAYIIDVDGTLANLDHRSPYAEDEALYAKDGVYEDVAALARTLGETYHVICVSGREDRFRDVTLDWLLRECFFEPDEFYMRATGDRRKDDIVKSEIFDRHIAGRFNVAGVIDDRPRVLRMWRAKGLTTYRVGDIDADF